MRNQAAKWQELWAGQQAKQSIFEQGFDLEAIRAPEILKAKDTRDASRIFKKRITLRWKDGTHGILAVCQTSSLMQLVLCGVYARCSWYGLGIRKNFWPS